MSLVLMVMVLVEESRVTADVSTGTGLTVILMLISQYDGDQVKAANVKSTYPSIPTLYI